MSDISTGILQAIDLIVTLDPEVMQIAALSLFISLSATIIAAVISIPLGGLIHFHEFRGKRVVIILIQTLYSVPTVVVGLMLYLLLSRSGPLGIFGLLFTPEGMIVGQTVLVIPITTGLVITALGGVDRNISDTLISLGATGFQTMIQVVKEARLAILSAVVLGFRSCDFRSRCGDDDRRKYQGCDTRTHYCNRVADRYRRFPVLNRSRHHPAPDNSWCCYYPECHHIRPIGRVPADHGGCTTGIIDLSGLSRRAGSKTILESVNLEIQRGEIFAFIGPSGSGKTTVLRLIDLLDMPTAGTITVDGTDTAASNAVRLSIRRRMAMVFQKPAVLNTTVAGNVAFGLKFREVEKSEIESRVHEALDIVGLLHLADRKAVTLSGGEMQRVAIARALVTRPEVLLLDEPTANLDPVNTDLIEKLILAIHKKFQTTIILSTHDMIQGQRLADRMGVIINGRIAQVGSIHDIFYRPQGRDIARFVGIDTILNGVVESNEEGLAKILVGKTVFEVITPCKPGTRVALFIRPEEVTIALKDGDLPKTSVRNQMTRNYHEDGAIWTICPYYYRLRFAPDSTGDP